MEEQRNMIEQHSDMKMKTIKHFELIYKNVLDLLEMNNKFQDHLDMNEKINLKLNEKLEKINLFFNEIKDEIKKEMNDDEFKRKKNDSSYKYNSVSESFENLLNNSSINFLKMLMESTKSIINHFFLLVQKSYVDRNKLNDLNISLENYNQQSKNLIKNFKNYIVKLNENDDSNNSNDNNIIIINNKVFNDSIVDKINNNDLDNSFEPIYIDTYEEYEEILKNQNNSGFIREINIIGEKLFCLSNLPKIDLSFLDKLKLKCNNLKVISSFKHCKFPGLYYLNLEDNELNNDCIDILIGKNFQHLTYLNLFNNKITSIRIFEIPKNIKTLKTFYIGKNLLDEKQIFDHESEIVLPNTLQKLGLSQNFCKVFGKTISLS